MDLALWIVLAVSIAAFLVIVVYPSIKEWATDWKKELIQDKTSDPTEKAKHKQGG